jgi:hypothetical protein
MIWLYVNRHRTEIDRHLDGRDRVLQSGDLLAANEKLYPQLLKLLKSAAK